MNALLIILLVATIIYLTLYQTSYWKYFFGILIPYYLITQVLLKDSKINTSKRNFYILLYSHPFDGQIYGTFKIKLNNLKEWIAKYNQTHNDKIGYTIFLLKLSANLLNKYSSINGHVIFGNFIDRGQIDISYMVAVDNGTKAEIITLYNANKLTLSEISQQVSQKKDMIAKNADPIINKKKFFSKILPSFCLPPFFILISYLSTLGLDLSFLGFPKKNQAPVIIVNYGKGGLSNTFLPIPRMNIYLFIYLFIRFIAFSFAPFCVGMSKIKEKVEDNEKIYTLKLTFTLDHRYIDGGFAVKIIQDIERVFLNPDLINDESFYVNPRDKKPKDAEDPSQKEKEKSS